MDANIERWRGNIEQQIKTIEDWCVRLKKGLDEVIERERTLEVRVENITTKLTIFATVSGFIGGGIVSLIIAFLFAEVKK